MLLQVAKKADASPQGTGHLYKVLRTCAQWELLVELPGKKFAANAATSALVRDGPPSLGHLAAHQINKPKQQAWQVIPWQLSLLCMPCQLLLCLSDSSRRMG